MNDHEKAVIQTIDGYIQNWRKHQKANPTVKIGNFTVKDVIGCKKRESNVKADFALLVLGPNAKEGKPHLYFTHKESNFSYNGYGSLGRAAFKTRSPVEDPEIWAFVKAARELCVLELNSQLPEPHFVSWPGTDKNKLVRGVWCIPPKRIQNIIEYGAHFGKRPFGEYNCQISSKGHPNFSSSGGRVELSFERFSENGTPSTCGDTPVIGVAADWMKKKNKILTKKDKPEGMHGWICAMPMRAVNKGIGKWERLQEIMWPKERIAELLRSFPGGKEPE